MIHGKAKQMFEEWLLFKSYNISRMEFRLLPLVFQQSLIVEWLDILQILIDVDLASSDGIFTACIYHEKHRLTNGKTLTTIKNFNTRPEATQKAIEKSILILNERL